MSGPTSKISSVADVEEDAIDVEDVALFARLLEAVLYFFIKEVFLVVIVAVKCFECGGLLIGRRRIPWVNTEIGRGQPQFE